MYLGMVLISAGVPLIIGLYIGLWAPLLLAVWLQIRFVLPKENFLRERLGMEYLLYASGHSRWLGLPGLQPSRMDAGAPHST
jgi:protein-S-isoprenylcysteine O-methyltransferase Ste14